MTCCHADFAFTDASDKAFTIGMPTFTFGAGCLAEAGEQALEHGMKHVALFTDRNLRGSVHVVTVIASLRAAGIEPPLDTVWADLRNSEGFARSAERAAALGFQGKMCIHPDQIGVTNAAFSPSEQQLSWAKRVVTAFEEAEAKGLASIQLDGQFIDYPIVQRARQVVAQGAA